MVRQDHLAQIASRFLRAFEEGTVPAALAQVLFELPADAIPCSRWSAFNRFLVCLAGTRDARGFRQWLAVGRHVRPGEKAFYILVPCGVGRRRSAEPDPAAEDGAEEEREKAPSCRREPSGYKFMPVFAFEQTEGEPLAHHETERRFVDTLPLVDVARAWEISIDLVPFNGRFFGAYQPVSRHISLSTFNRRTWAHELVHAADDRRGFLPLGEKKTAETLAEAEIVAELGAAVLLEAVGESEHVDLGAASRYLQHYAGEPSRCVAACRRLLQRTCGAVGLILDTADQLRALGPMPSAAIVEALEVTP